MAGRSYPVTVYLPPKDYVVVYAAAQARGVSVATYLRREAVEAARRAVRSA